MKSLRRVIFTTVAMVGVMMLATGTSMSAGSDNTYRTGAWTTTNSDFTVSGPSAAAGDTGTIGTGTGGTTGTGTGGNLGTGTGGSMGTGTGGSMGTGTGGSMGTGGAGGGGK
jgi:hypothetical protein